MCCNGSDLIQEALGGKLLGKWQGMVSDEVEALLGDLPCSPARATGKARSLQSIVRPASSILVDELAPAWQQLASM